jgi:peptide/nickel transport system substrate-binding protein
LMKDIQRIQQERGSVAIAWWQSVWDIKSPKLKDAPAHPTAYHLWRAAWIDPDAK